jgi:two-component system response regulator MprA
VVPETADVQHDRGVRPITVGVCEDDASLRSVLRRALSGEGFEVRATATGREAVETFSATAPDLLVLDIGLPDADGRDVCQALRSHGLRSPVLFLTARDALPDRLSGFHAGGDDYLTKPFALAELLVRVRALLARSAGDAPAEDERGLRLDPAAHAVRREDRVEALTPTEFRLLAALTAKPGTVVRRRELVNAAWPDGAIVHENTLDTYIGRLRRKLRSLDAEQTIVTARGVGYSLR